MSKNLHKKFIEETGQVLRYVSWKYHRKIKKKTQKISETKEERRKRNKSTREALRRLRN